MSDSSAGSQLRGLAELERGSQAGLKELRRVEQPSIEVLRPQERRIDPRLPKYLDPHWAQACRSCGTVLAATHDLPLPGKNERRGGRG